MHIGVLRAKENGFTLIEMLLVFSLLAILGVLSIPIYNSFQNRNDLDIAQNSVVSSLRRAQSLAGVMYGDAPWGVYVGENKITLFKGENYLTREIIYDEFFDLPESITPSGTVEIVFEKFSALPNTNGTLVLTSNTNETRNITINEKGMVDF